MKKDLFGVKAFLNDWHTAALKERMRYLLVYSLTTMAGIASVVFALI